MDQTHVHLLITHLPIFGSLLGAIVLAYALWVKSNHTQTAAYLLMIIAAAGAGIAYLTGEAAEETVERLPGVSESMIEQHEDFAVYALVGLLVVGIASVAGLLLIRSKSVLTRPVAIATLLLTLISFGLVARTGYLGGQVRHSEVRSGAKDAGNDTNRGSSAAEQEEMDR